MNSSTKRCKKQEKSNLARVIQENFHKFWWKRKVFWPKTPISVNHSFFLKAVWQGRSWHQKMMFGVDLKPLGIFSSLCTQTGPWFDTASYVNYENKIFETNLKLYLDEKWRGKKDWEKDANSREEKSLKVSHFIFKIWCIGVFHSYSILLKTDFLFYFSFRESNIR